MRDVYIVSAVRTPIAKMGGVMQKIQPETLAKVVLEELLKRGGISSYQVDEVILAQTRQSTDAPNIARVAALLAGYPESIPAYTVMQQCGSSMQAVFCGANNIRCGYADTVVVGGTESLSNAPFYLRNARYGYGVGNGVLVDSIPEGQINSQPVSIYGKFSMGDTAENLAEQYHITREEQDEFAYESQRRAAQAIAGNIFKDEIVPVAIPQKKGDPIVYDTDEHPRATTIEKLSKLPPVFRKDGKGTVTAGNACGRNDAASALLLMSGEKVKELGVSPMAKITGQASVGVSPRIMGIGPVNATKKALASAGLTLKDIGMIELNEAFAAQSLAVIKELGMDRHITNVSGGAIALGHPLGATGARILTTLVYGMRRAGVKYGLATLCIGGGMGSAAVLEMVT